MVGVGVWKIQVPIIAKMGEVDMSLLLDTDSPTAQLD